MFVVISLCMRKPAIWVSDQVRYKPGCTVTQSAYADCWFSGAFFIKMFIKCFYVYLVGLTLVSVSRSTQLLRPYRDYVKGSFLLIAIGQKEITIRISGIDFLDLCPWF